MAVLGCFRWRNVSREEDGHERLALGLAALRPTAPLPRTSAQMVEDPLDDHRIFNTGNDFYRPATVQAGLKVDPQGSLHRKQTLKHLFSNGYIGSLADPLTIIS